MPSYQNLMNGLEELGIQQMQEHLPYLVNKGEKSFTEALEELVEIEKTAKQIRRDNINLHIANFPFMKTMDDFDFTFQPSINKKEILELNNLGFVERRENVVFVGSSGVGKTHLATALGISCTKARYQTYFISFEALITQLKRAHLENHMETRLKFFAKYKILINIDIYNCLCYIVLVVINENFTSILIGGN